MSRNRPALGISVVLVAALLAGCGSTSAAPELPSVANPSASSTTQPTGSPTPKASVDPEEAMAKYNRCMADHGVKMQILAGGSGGGLLSADSGSGGQPDSGTPPTKEQMDAAAKACDPILKDSLGAFKPDPNQEAEMKDKMLVVQRCLKKKGIDGGIAVASAVGDDGVDTGDMTGKELKLPDGMTPEEFSKIISACSKEAGLGDGMSVTSGSAS